MTALHARTVGEAAIRRDPHASPQLWRRYAHWLFRLPEQQAINRIFRWLGRLHQADRVWMVRYDREVTHFWHLYEWTRLGIPTFVKDLQAVPVEWLKWVHETVLQDRPLYLEDATSLPRRAHHIEMEFRRQEIRSLLTVPAFLDGKITLLMGYDAVRQTHRWQPAEVEALHEVARLVAASSRRPDPPTFPRSSIDQDELWYFAHQSGMTFRVARDQIVHCEAWGSDTRLFLGNGQIVLDQRGLGHWQRVLPQDQFLRVHRSRIVNLSYLERLDRRGDGWALVMKGIQGRLRVGRSYQLPLRHAIGL